MGNCANPARQIDAHDSASHSPTNEEQALVPGKQAPKDASVGVLGWLGFIIINFAAWGIIGVSTSIGWVIGFVASLVYTGVLIGLALWLRRTFDREYREFSNLLWVLACSFIFIIGMYLTFHVVGPIFGESQQQIVPDGPTVIVDNDLTKLLPEGVPSAVKDYAALPAQYANEPTYAVFHTHAYFTAKADGPGAVADVLRNFDGETVSPVMPQVMDVRNFRELHDKLFFLASEYDASGSKRPAPSLFSIDPGSLKVANLVGAPDEGSNAGADASLFDLKLFGETLYFKGSYLCDGSWTMTIFTYKPGDGGITNLRKPPCAPQPNDGGDTTTPAPGQKKPIAEMWGAVLLACLPMIGVALATMLKLGTHGTFANIYIGVIILAGLFYLIVMPWGSSPYTFLQRCVTWLSTGICLAFGFYCLTKKSKPEWIEDMEGLTDWIVVFAGFSCWWMIHVNLEVPFTDSWINWIAYAILIPIEMVFSVCVQRTLPMTLSAVSLFIMSYKIARETTMLVFGHTYGEIETVAMLSMMVLQGIGIIGGAIAYSGNRETIDNKIRGMFSRCLGSQ